MAFNVHILPSDRNFISEGNATILEAGLSSGLALGYGCSNGNCGKCLARILSGEVHKIRHHDFKIDEQQQINGHVLMCCNTALSDIKLEAPEANNSSEIPEQNITAKVKSINIVNNDVALVHLKTPRTNRLRFLAGQHVSLRGSDLSTASHSISSCPCDDMNLHFQIPRLPENGFSEFVFKQLKKGDTIHITGPQGDFVLDEDSPRSLVFVAWQTGFAPIRSLIEHAMALDMTGDIHLLRLTNSKKDRYLDNLCRSWNDAFDNFYYVPIDVDPAQEIDPAIIIESMSIESGDLSGYDFYFAGNSVLSGVVENHLINSGLQEEQINVDQKPHL